MGSCSTLPGHPNGTPPGRLGPWILELGIWTLELAAWNLQLGTLLEAWNLELGPWTLELGTWSLELGLELGARNLVLAPLTWNLTLCNLEIGTPRVAGAGAGRSHSPARRRERPFPSPRWWVGTVGPGAQAEELESPAARREARKSIGSKGFRSMGREGNRDRSPRKKKSKGSMQNQWFGRNEIQSRRGAATWRTRQAKRQPSRKSEGLIRNQWFWRNEIQG